MAELIDNEKIYAAIERVERRMDSSIGDERTPTTPDEVRAIAGAAASGLDVQTMGSVTPFFDQEVGITVWEEDGGEPEDVLEGELESLTPEERSMVEALLRKSDRLQRALDQWYGFLVGLECAKGQK